MLRSLVGSEMCIRNRYSDGPGGLESLADRSLFTNPGPGLVGASADIECRLAGLDFWFAPAGLGAATAWPHDWYSDFLHQSIQPLVQAGRSADGALPGLDLFSLGAQFCDLGHERRALGADKSVPTIKQRSYKIH